MFGILSHPLSYRVIVVFHQLHFTTCRYVFVYHFIQGRNYFSLAVRFSLWSLNFSVSGSISFLGYDVGVSTDRWLPLRQVWQKNNCWCWLCCQHSCRLDCSVSQKLYGVYCLPINLWNGIRYRKLFIKPSVWRVFREHSLTGRSLVISIIIDYCSDESNQTTVSFERVQAFQFKLAVMTHEGRVFWRKTAPFLYNQLSLRCTKAR